MSARGRIAERIRTQYSIGAVVSLEAMRELDKQEAESVDGERMDDKTLRNRIGELCRDGLLARTSKGVYLRRQPPPLPMIGAVPLNDTTYRKIGGTRSRPPKAKADRDRWARARYLSTIFGEQRRLCACCARDVGHQRHAALDHVHPLSKGGENAPANYVMLCLGCNLAKGTKTMAEARADSVKDGSMVDVEKAKAAERAGYECGFAVPEEFFSR